MKYKIFKTKGKIDRDIRKHELIGIEYGKDIYSATDDIIRAVTDDLKETEEYQHVDVSAYAPEPVEDFRRSHRYDYYSLGIVSPPHAAKNILIEYGIIETN